MKKFAWAILSLFVGCTPVAADKLDTGDTISVVGFCTTEMGMLNLAKSWSSDGVPALNEYIKASWSECYALQFSHIRPGLTGLIIEKVDERTNAEDGYTMEVYQFFAPWIRDTQTGWTWVFVKTPGEML